MEFRAPHISRMTLRPVLTALALVLGVLFAPGFGS